MKISPIPLARILPALLLFVLFLITTSARAAVHLTFSQRGNDVVITLSGSTTIPGFAILEPGPVNQFNSNGFYHLPVTQFGYVGIIPNDTGFPIVSGVFDSSSTASAFGVVDRAIFFGPGLSEGSLWAPTGELVIKNHTYLTLFGTYTPTGPTAQWYSGVVAISSTVTPVPESSAAVLSILGVGVLVGRRRRL
ncbi:MAG: hypothetical protein EOP85_13460 [Verrucomicrobiaceae bacterium]|nr:MAG: hypothetical protein EOP85_13460 [Verrucomicrobiaceae bacterium]